MYSFEDRMRAVSLLLKDGRNTAGAKSPMQYYQSLNVRKKSKKTSAPPFKNFFVCLDSPSISTMILQDKMGPNGVRILTRRNPRCSKKLEGVIVDGIRSASEKE